MRIPSDYSPPIDLLRDRVVFISGASDGIGRAVAVTAAKFGASVILHGRSKSKLERVYDEIVAMGAPRPSIAQLDFEKAGPEQYQTIADALLKEFGRLDVLLHNASMLGERAPVEHYDVAKWMRTVHVNVNAPFILTRYFLPLLKASADPSIVFTSSGIVPKPRPFWGAYLVSKWATEGMARMLAEELDSTPVIRVNTLNPGKVRTGLRLQAYPAEDRSLLPTPESIAESYLYLFGPDSKTVTGQYFEIQ